MTELKCSDDVRLLWGFSLRPGGRNWKMTMIFLSTMAMLEYAVFSGCLSQFFQGDALFWMLYRFRHWREFFHSLISLDVANWYRPLSNRTIPTLFYHWFGLNPYGYHWVTLSLFFVATCLIFLFLRELTGKPIVAFAGTVFSCIHSINVYLTYDFTTAPELFYASFYLASCIAFLRASESKRWYLVSLLFFLLAMMSKEPAVTLPVNIVLISIFLHRRERKYLLGFFGLLAVYYLYIVRFLKVGAGDYSLAFHKDIFPRISESLLWAMNLGRGRMYDAVAAMAILVGTYAIASLFRPYRKSVLLGIGWFVVALSPMLGIVGYFGAYYLFLPLVGIGLIVGEFFNWLYTMLIRQHPRLAVIGVCLGLIPFVAAAIVNARHDLVELGRAGGIAEKSILDLKRLHPSLPKGATIYIDNSTEPDLWRIYGLGALFKLFYYDDSLDVLYSSVGHSVPRELLRNGKAVAAIYSNEGLADLSRFEDSKSTQDFQYRMSDRFKLQVFPSRVHAGRGSFTIRVSNAQSAEAILQYQFNDGPLTSITLHLDPKGETHFFVSNETKRGSYRFVGLRVLPDAAWIRVEGNVFISD